jgi:hypothetical protein
MARRVHDRALVVYLCASCHEVVTAWMYRLRMIRREPRRDTCWQEREWAIAQGLLVIVLLSRPSKPPPIANVAVVGQAIGAVLRASASREGLEPRFSPDPLRADTQAGHTLPQIERLDPNWVELLRLVARAGARLWPEQEQLFARLEGESERIVFAIGLLDGDEISNCPPTLRLIVDAFESIFLALLLGGDDPAPVLEVLERFGAQESPAFAGLLAFADASTHERAQAVLADLFQRYAQTLSLEAA